jgi:hypothetical protein
VQHAQGAERELPAAVRTAERKETNLAEGERLATFFTLEFLLDHRPIGKGAKNASCDRVDEDNFSTLGMLALHAPDGEIDHGEDFPHEAVENHFGNQLFRFEKYIGKSVRLDLGLFQRNLQGKKRIPLLQMLPPERLEAKRLGADAQGGKAHFQAPISGNRVVQYAGEKNL